MLWPTNDEAPMKSALAPAAPEDRCDSPVAPIQLKPHSYPLWLVAVAFLVACAVVYSAILVPPYLGAYASMRLAESALEKGDRAAAETQFLNVLRAFPTSTSARIEIAIMLLADPVGARQQSGLDYLAGIKLDKYQWRRVSAVLPERFQDRFQTVKK
jgi:hypothetical protein